jgi:hypothetical protein
MIYKGVLDATSEPSACEASDLGAGSECERREMGRGAA